MSVPAELLQMLIDALGDAKLAAQAASGVDIPVDSSDLSSVSYDIADESMEITFQDGSTYSYSGVSPFVYARLMSADSKGSYFSANIRGRYPYSRV